MRLVKFYSSDEHGEVQIHMTDTLAKSEANRSIGQAKHRGCGVWPSGMSNISYGMLVPLGIAQQTNVRSEDYETTCDYELDECNNMLKRAQARMEEALLQLAEEKLAHEETKARFAEAVDLLRGKLTAERSVHAAAKQELAELKDRFAWHIEQDEHSKRVASAIRFLAAEAGNFEPILNHARADLIKQHAAREAASARQDP